MPLPLKPFHMIRHGQSTANADYLFAGIHDVALTAQGVEEAKKAGSVYATLKDKPSIIIHSKLSRARDTASLINDNLNLEMVEHEDIHEQDFGDWESQSVELFLESYHNRQPPKNGESFEEFDERIRASITDILHRYENPLIVCHGGVFRAFHCLYDVKRRFPTENAVPHLFNPIEENTSFPWEIEIIG